MRSLTTAELNMVSGGGDECCYCPPPPTEKEKGNNGWGNGTDGNNPGSFKGGSEPSKSINDSNPGNGKINLNPTESDGR